MIRKAFYREFYGVGHGAFYSEHFVLNTNGPINVVFDCGTRSAFDIPYREIAKFYVNINSIDIGRNIIDLLFISHFDEDHVNGLKELYRRCDKIKKVVLPVLRNDDEKWLAITEYGIRYSDNYERALSLFRANGTELVFVKPVDDGFSKNENEEANFKEFTSEREPIQLENLHGTIDSGTPIVLSFEKIDWIYIPIYFDNLLKVRDAVKAQIEKIQKPDGKFLKVDDLVNAKTFSRNLLTQINSAYKKVVGSSNLSSMLCYSGPGRHLLAKSHTIKVSGENEILGIPSKLGCLYTGDARLKKNQCIAVKSLLGKRNVDNIEFFQLPHHGSKYNITLKSVENYLGLDFEHTLNFTSCGSQDNNHPSRSVLSEIKKRNGTFFLIDEERDLSEEVSFKHM